MKLRTSPVFYFGILLVLLVGAALAAPYVVDWNRYRTDIEAYGRKLTGRDVSAPGDIDVRIFPWPKLSIRDVRIANPPGFDQPVFATIERVDVRVALAGLISGRLDVEAIDLVRPDAVLIRTGDGRANWRFTPELNLSEGKLLDHVRLDQIAITDGAIRLTDGRRKGALALGSVNGTLSAPAIAGPWRARAGFKANDASYDFSFNSNPWVEGSPLKFAFRLARENAALSFDGASSGAVDGTIRFEPGTQPDGKAGKAGPLDAYALSAKINADFNHVSLSEIEITQGAEDTIALEGSAHATLGASFVVDADLSVPKFNLDPILGQTLDDPMAAAGALLGAVPADLSGRGSLKVGNLTAGGEILQNATLSATFGPGAIKIDELSARLPNQSAGRFSGLLLDTSKGPQLAGDVSFETLDARGFLSWAKPEWNAAIETHWTGSRGRLTANARLDAVPGHVRTSKGAYVIDGASGTFTGESSPVETALRLETDLIDLDAFRPEGLPGDMDVAALAAVLPTKDHKFVVQAAKLRLNGITAKDVAIDLRANPAGFDLQLAEIGNVGGARFEAGGALKFDAGVPEGALEANLKAEDPRALIALLGLMDDASAAGWTRALGATDLKVVGTLRPEDGQPSAFVEARGYSGDLNIQGSLALSGSLDWRAAELAGEGTVTSASSAALVRLFGLNAAGQGDVPGSLKLTATGSLASGLVTDVMANLYGVDVTVQTKPGSEGLSGEVAVTAPDIALAAAVIGFPANVGGPLKATAVLTAESGGVRIDPVSGVFGGSAFSGQAYLGSGRNLVGRFEADRASIWPILAAFSLPWSGPADLEGPFARAAPFGLTGEVWIKPKHLDVLGVAEVSGFEIGIMADGVERRITARAKQADGQNLTVELALKADGDETAAEAKIALPLALGDMVKDSKGAAILDGMLDFDLSLKGRGRSPAGALAAANGSGSYALSNGAILGLAPEPFLEAAAAATTQPDLETAFARLTGGGRIETGPLAGIVTVVNGALALESRRISTPVADISIDPRADLASGTLDLGLGLSFKSGEALPAMGITYSGEPNALLRLVDSNQLLSALGIQVLKRGVTELERLQREQQRIAEEEEEQRKEDEARLAAWEYHRREVQSRLREIKMRAGQDAAAEAAAKAEEKRRLAEGAAINKLEIARHLRGFKEVRRQRREAERRAAEAAEAELAAARPVQTPIFEGEEPVPVPKLKPKPKPAAKPQPPGPIDLRAPKDSKLDQLIESTPLERP